MRELFDLAMRRWVLTVVVVVAVVVVVEHTRSERKRCLGSSAHGLASKPHRAQ